MAVEAESASPARHGRIATALTGSRELARIAYRDPQPVAERLTLFAAQSLGEPSRAWAEATPAARPGLCAPGTAACTRSSSSGASSRLRASPTRTVTAGFEPASG